MRRFDDSEGATWDVTLGRASWGAFYALFVPRGERDGVRQTLLAPDGPDEAARFLNSADDHELERLFEASEPRPPE